MAVSKVSDRAGWAENSPSTSFGFGSIEPSAAGNWYLARVAMDNAGTDGVAPTITYIIDGPDQATWTQVASVTQDSGAANEGCTVLLIKGETGGSYEGDPLFVGFAANVTAKAGAIDEWTGLPAFPADPVSNTVTSTGVGTSPTVTITADATGNLIYGLLATEGPIGDTYTEDDDTTNGSWVPLPRFGIGSGDTGMTIAGAYKIVEAPGDQTWNPTITSRDYAMVLAQLAATYVEPPVPPGEHTDGMGQMGSHMNR